MYDDEQTTAPTDEAEVEGHKVHSGREDGIDKPDEDVEGHKVHSGGRKFHSGRSDKPDDEDVEGHRIKQGRS